MAPNRTYYEENLYGFSPPAATPSTELNRAIPAAQRQFPPGINQVVTTQKDVQAPPPYVHSDEATEILTPIGYPPNNLYFSKDVLRGSIPIMHLIPGQGQFVAGLDVFTFDSKLDEFKRMLSKEYDLILKTGSSIDIAFSPEAIPGIQLSNDYGASFLETIANVGGPVLGQIAQMTGSKNLGELVSKGGTVGREAGGEAGKKAGGQASKLINSMWDLAEGMADKGISMLPAEMQVGANNMKETGKKVLGAMLTGARVDFPKVWMGSGFSGPVSIPIRLYNPNQASQVSYSKYIIEPLTVLLNLGAPISDMDNLYRWPYIHQISCPGIFKWRMAALVGLTVTPGSERQMSWNNRPSMIDVRLDFQPLHSVMLGRRTSNNVPAVGDYLQQLRTQTEAPHLWNVPGGAPVVKQATSYTRSDPVDRNEAAGTPRPPEPVVLDGIPARVTDVNIAAWEKLVAAQRAQGINPSATRLASERETRDAAAKAKAAEDFQSQAVRDQQKDMQTLKDMTTKDAAEASPQSTGEQMASASPGPTEAELLALEGVNLPQYGAGNVTPGPTPDELAASDVGPPKQQTFLGGVASSLKAAGDAAWTGASVVGSAIATSVINVANPSWTQSTEPAVKPSTTVPTTIDEARKEVVYPDVNNGTIPQANQQAMSSEVSSENQTYSNSMSVLRGLYARAIPFSSNQTEISQLITKANLDHQINLAAIANKYK